MKATYVSEWDDSLTCTSDCDYDPVTKVVSNIEPADNAEYADFANCLTAEYIIFQGDRLTEDDGITFDY